MKPIPTPAIDARAERQALIRLKRLQQRADRDRLHRDRRLRALAIARDAVALVVASGGSKAKRREVLRMIADAALAAEEGLS